MLKHHYLDVAQNQDDYWWYRGMREINKTLLDLYLIQKRGLKILDAGCGPGANLLMLKKYGEVIGVDMSDTALKFAKKRGNVIKGDITDLSFNDNTFDLVICMDVLYHTWVKDENKAIAEFKRVLKPGGILLIREPAFEWLRGNEDRGSLTQRRFQVRDLKNSLNIFKIQKISYANFILFPIFLIVRLLTKLNGGNGSSDMIIPNKWINEFLFSILKFEAFILRYTNLPFGSSLFCVVSKI